ncbi:MAG: SDR family NAD(P)-dependent oxidoreductase [Dehalococcoidia bacterium]|nr:SDR family NAD(P)-dependent oxidoreductase [Dehalococcoidia bacterium]
MGKFDLSGKNVLITGASSGIGKELSRCFAAEGANLYMGCRPSEKDQLEGWAAEVEQAYGVKTATFPIDLASDRGPEELHEAARKAAGKIDVLVNNAGIFRYGSFHEIPLDYHDCLVRVNLMAYYKLMRLAIPHMVEAREGRVLNVVSAAAFQPTVYHAIYGAAKSFVQSLSEAVNQEVRGTGVKICTLNPPYTDTALLRDGGFPTNIWWLKVSGLCDAGTIARKGTRAFKAGKEVYIPGFINAFLHTILIRFFPRRVVNAISCWSLRVRA